MLHYKATAIDRREMHRQTIWVRLFVITKWQKNHVRMACGFSYRPQIVARLEYWTLLLLFLLLVLFPFRFQFVRDAVCEVAMPTKMVQRSNQLFEDLTCI